MGEQFGYRRSLCFLHTPQQHQALLLKPNQTTGWQEIARLTSYTYLGWEHSLFFLSVSLLEMNIMMEHDTLQLIEFVKSLAKIFGQGILKYTLLF